ncbi:MAG: chorismate mutase [Chthoniobacterales bacterium]
MNKSDSELQILRHEIDLVDRSLLDLLARRASLVKQIGSYKREHHVQLLDLARWKEVMQVRIIEAEKMGLGPKFIREIFELIHRYSLSLQSSTKEVPIHRNGHN